MVRLMVRAGGGKETQGVIRSPNSLYVVNSQ